MGRAVFVLCLLVGVANACPIRFDSPEEKRASEEMMLRELGHKQHAQPAVAAQLGANVSDEWHGAAMAFALMGLCGLAFSVTRANAVRRTFATSQRMVEAHPDVMKRVVRTQSARTAMFIGICAAALGIVATLPIELEARVILAVTPAMLLTIGMIALYRLVLLDTLEPDEHTRVTSHGDYLFVARDKRLVGWVAAPPALLARASALPTAKLHR